MIPLRDSTRSSHFPLVNLTLIVVNVLVFLFELSLSQNALEALFQAFGVVPARMASLSGGVASLVTAAFLHAGWLHLGGNMLYLWVFGDNVEDRLGHARYLLFYLLTAVTSNVVHVVMTQTSQVPTVGASGAIAAVLGAYMILFPGARVLALVPIGFLWVTEVPAVVFLFIWFVMQLLNGLATLGVSTSAGGDVAYWAHIGGFVAGMAFCLILAPRRRMERTF